MHISGLSSRKNLRKINQCLIVVNMLSISVEQGLRVEVNFYSGENKVTGCYSSPQVDATHLRSQITVALYHSSFSLDDSSSAFSASRFNLTEQHLSQNVTF